jgi:hypothetical protein
MKRPNEAPAANLAMTSSFQAGRQGATLGGRKTVKVFSIRFVAQMIGQLGAMIFFMRVMRWDIIVSAGLSALVGLACGLLVYFIQKRSVVSED